MALAMILPVGQVLVKFRVSRRRREMYTVSQKRPILAMTLTRVLIYFYHQFVPERKKTLRQLMT